MLREFTQKKLLSNNTLNLVDTFQTKSQSLEMAVFDMKQVTKAQTFEVGLIHGDPQLSFLNVKEDKIKIRIEVLKK